MRRCFLSANPQRICIIFSLTMILLPLHVHAQLNVFEKPKKRAPKKRKSFTFGPIKLGSQAGRADMQRGNRSYAQKDYQTASIMYYRVVSKARNSRYFQQAQFRLATALYRLKLRNAAVMFYSDILKAGPQHQYFKQSLGYVLTINKALNNESAFLGKLKKFRSTDFPSRYRNTMFYLLGRYYFERTDLPTAKRLKLARRLLVQVRSNSPADYARAQYILGATYDAGKSPNNAARSFKRAIRASLQIKDKALRQKVFEYGILGMARLHYSAQHFVSAVRWYRLIPRNSPFWLDSLFERAWASLRQGRYADTLGILHTLESPYFVNEYYPETGILRALSFLERCRFTDVKRILKSYLSRYRPLIGFLDRFLKQQRAPYLMYKKLKALRKKSIEKGLDKDKSTEMFQRILKLTFKDRKLQRTFAHIRAYDQEITSLRKSENPWKKSALGVILTKQLRSARLARIKAAGTRATNEIKSARSDLGSLIGQALKIQYDTLEEEKKFLSRAAGKSGGFKMKVRGQKRKSNRKLFSVAVRDDFTFWPFQGEYWVDELGYYVYRLRGECHRR